MIVQYLLHITYKYYIKHCDLHWCIFTVIHTVCVVKYAVQPCDINSSNDKYIQQISVKPRRNFCSKHLFCAKGWMWKCLLTCYCCIFLHRSSLELLMQKAEGWRLRTKSFYHIIHGCKNHYENSKHYYLSFEYTVSFHWSGLLRPGFRWWFWWWCPAEAVCWGSGSQVDHCQSCWSPPSCGECCAASGGDYETLSPSSLEAAWIFFSVPPSSAGCRPRDPGSGSMWPYVSSADWKMQNHLWLWYLGKWHGSCGVVTEQKQTVYSIHIIKDQNTLKKVRDLCTLYYIFFRFT